jgi:hypothetical protein
MTKQTTKVIALALLAFIATAQIAAAASEFTGTLSGAYSTDSMSNFSGSLSGTSNDNDDVAANDDDEEEAAAGLNRSGGRRGGGGGAVFASNTGGGTANSAGDIIIILDNPDAGLTGTGGGYNPALENYLSGVGGADTSAGAGEDTTGASSEDLLALNTGAAVPQFLGGEQAATIRSQCRTRHEEKRQALNLDGNR